jgi:hypothetical protein
MASERNMTFSAPWGRSTWVISLLACGLVVGATAIGLTNLALPRVAIFALVSAPLLILVVTVPFMIFGYEVREQTLVIKRLGWTTEIPLNGIREAQANPKAMYGSIRIFGNGGLFAFNGIFWSKALGRYRAYVTDLSRSVVLKLSDRTVVISPDAPERFLTELQKRQLLTR